MMSEVEWLEISTGMTQFGAKDLHIAGDGWVPVCWIMVGGTKYKTLLSDLSNCIQLKTRATVSLEKNEAYKSVNGMVVVIQDDDDYEEIEQMLPLFKYMVVRYMAGQVIDIGYQQQTSYPNSEEWVWTGEIDTDYHYKDPMTGGKTAASSGTPAPPSPHDIPSPRPGPVCPGPGPAPPGPPSPPPPMPGPSPFLDDNDDVSFLGQV